METHLSNHERQLLIAALNLYMNPLGKIEPARKQNAEAALRLQTKLVHCRGDLKHTP